MEAKHTPGPWFAKREGFSTVYIEARLRAGVLQEVAACGPTEAGQEQQEANARLIAAAPDLLAALEAYTVAQKMPTHGDSSDFVWPEITMRQPGITAYGWICAKHGLGYQSGCICCRNEFDEHQERKNREARYARDDALRAAEVAARAAIDKATAGAA